MQKRSSSKSKKGSQGGDDLWQWAAHREESTPPAIVRETSEMAPPHTVTGPGKIVNALSSLLGIAKDAVPK